MEWLDATLPLHRDMVLFPGDPPFGMEPIYRKEGGDPFSLSLVAMGTHVGTHVDPPAHYLPRGSTVDQLPLETLMGPGVVVDLRGRPRLDRPVLEQAGLTGEVRVLFKTDNGPKLLDSRFHEDYVHLTLDGAQYLVDLGVRLVGIDYLSIEQYRNPGAPVHHLLLQAQVVILEGAYLLEVPPGPYEIFCLPLRLKGGDGAPVRLILKKRAKETAQGHAVSEPRPGR